MTHNLDDYLDQQDLWAYDDGGPEHCEACGKDVPLENMGDIYCLYCETTWPPGNWTRDKRFCTDCGRRWGHIWVPHRRRWQCAACGNPVLTVERRAEVAEAVAGLSKVDVYGR